MQRVGIYPGTFDPITFGHADIIQKSLKIRKNQRFPRVPCGFEI